MSAPSIAPSLSSRASTPTLAVSQLPDDKLGDARSERSVAVSVAVSDAHLLPPDVESNAASANELGVARLFVIHAA
ncbi:hypothetical protein FRC10_004029 [Ceratobasidium sp. 414]|nr:hypothetical protein FRC10_004029 [Ceratobasidium sp. 414]